MERGATVPIGTVLVGPNVLLREGLARILSAADFSILGSASGVDDPLLSSLPQEQPILLIIDASDDFDTALGQIESFKNRHPAGRVAVLAHEHQLTDMVSAFRLGANAYLVNVATCDTFIKSLELIMLGVTLLPPEILAFISDRQDRSRNGAAGHAVHAIALSGNGRRLAVIADLLTAHRLIDARAWGALRELHQTLGPVSRANAALDRRQKRRGEPPR